MELVEATTWLPARGIYVLRRNKPWLRFVVSIACRHHGNRWRMTRHNWLLVAADLISQAEHLPSGRLGLDN